MLPQVVIGVDTENFTQFSCREWNSDHEADGTIANLGAFAFMNGKPVGSFFTEKPHEVVAFFANPATVFGLSRNLSATLVFFNQRYDIHVLRDFLPDDFVMANAGSRYFPRPYKSSSGKKVYFRDLSYFYVGQTLESVGKSLGCPVAKQDIGDAEKRVLTDAYITGWCWNAFVDVCSRIAGKSLEQVNVFPATPASLTKLVFGSYPEYEHIRRDKNYAPEVEDLLARCNASGGRTEGFAFGRRPANRAYDVNSLYPAVMKSELYPTGTVSYTNEPKEIWELFVDGAEGVYDVEVWLKDCEFPPLPIVVGGKTVYPTGHFRGVWTFPMLEYAISKGVFVTKLFAAATWPTSASVFAPYIEEWERLKIEATETGDEALRGLAKLMSNSLFGKFGERFHNDQFLLTPDGLVENPEYVSEGAPAFVGSSNAIIARYVTSYAQILLHRGLCAMSESGAQVIYCDTDSIKAQVPEGWTCPLDVHSSRYGAWKDETEGMTEIEVWSPKVYWTYDADGACIGSHHKGVPMRAQIEKTETELTATWDAPDVGKSAWLRGVVGAPWIEKCRSIVSNMAGGVSKRKIASDGTSRAWDYDEFIDYLKEG